ncbi:sugar transferase [Anaerocolumna sp. AGMB13020]|uniref:sugar transferase n=1 Tax=Anaerocolumna sp. AGMB13020 TaxID=3081750 RepID=UPI0029534FEB|nr:sugar transferase [Anaerocolumna sp. AGMB13020]WOO35443.1 sugar transferase [Anaerocolumna sp. AGMB13020]
MYNKIIKRILDIMIAFLSLIILAGIILMISLLIKITSKGKVLYRQKRVGKNKKEFYILKFRTMSSAAPKDVPTHLLENPDQYITRIGKLLRKTSLDELPQLVNILKGDMSLVGPRPALWNQFDLIKERDRYGANDVRPGLTGWAQINGRDEVPIPLKVRYDSEYIQKMSFLFDLTCMSKTVVCVVKHEGVREGALEGGTESKYENGIDYLS